jgi:transposase, IS5 family
MEEAFFGTPLYREFAQLQEFGRFPDESTILRFHHRLEKYKLAVCGSSGNVHDVLESNSLLHGEETVAFCDA